MTRIGFSGRPVSQRDKEFNELLLLVEENKCTSYLEVGARHGDSFYDIVTQMPKGSKACAIDLPGDAWGMADSQEALVECIKELCTMGYDANVIFCDSTSEGAIQFAEENGPFDLVFLDGDHRYEGIKKDYQNYKDLASKMIAFHDIGEVAYNPKHDMSVEVKTLWDEIKNDSKTYYEFIEPNDKFLMGIGVMVLSEGHIKNPRGLLKAFSSCYP